MSIQTTSTRSEMKISAYQLTMEHPDVARAVSQIAGALRARRVSEAAYGRALYVSDYQRSREEREAEWQRLREAIAAAEREIAAAQAALLTAMEETFR